MKKICLFLMTLLFIFVFSINSYAFSEKVSAPSTSDYHWYSSDNPFYSQYTGQCTWYAWGRAYEIMGKKLPAIYVNNGHNSPGTTFYGAAARWWYDNLYLYKNNLGGFRYGQTPEVGSIMVWGVSSENSGGHVAIVEAVSGSTITISEGNYSGKIFNRRSGTLATINAGTSTNGVRSPFLGFIYINSHTHSYSQGYEAAHPHRIYMMCDCGDYYYTGTYAESYTYDFDSEHPHRKYRECFCGNLSYFDEYQFKTECSDCALVNLGDDFYAKIINVNTNQPIVNTGSLVTQVENTDEKNRIWQFIRLSDGSYTIKSLRDGKVLDVQSALTASETPVQVYDSNSTNAQKWEIRGTESDYTLKAKCTSCVLDVPFGAFNGESSIWTYTYNNTAAQKFEIVKVYKPTLSLPVLNIQVINEEVPEVTFLWEQDAGATSYDLEIFKDGQSYSTICDITTGSYTLEIDPGSYTAVLTSFNDVFSISYSSNPTPFVATPLSYKITFDANGGTGGPTEDKKYHNTPYTIPSDIPTKEGSVFYGWSTSKTDYSEIYFVSSTYTDNKDCTLYAIWDIKDMGTLGDNITWTLFNNGELSVNGTGDMYNYLYSTSPWITKGYEKDITSIDIESGITSIGDYVFMGLESIQSIQCPNTITHIGKAAFQDTSVEEIILPENLTTFGDSAFENCYNLKQLKIPEGVTSLSYRMFYSCDSLKNIEMPDTLITIGQQVFWNCDLLKDITFPENLTTIDSYAFHGCMGLKKLKLPDNLSSLGDYVFHDCYNLEEINIPKNMSSLGVFPFDYCPLQKIEVSAENLIYSSDENGILYDKEKETIIIYPPKNPLTVLEIPSSVKTISDYAFYKCQILEEIIIPDSVTHIGDYAFYLCKNLKSAIVSDGLTEIGDCAFSSSGLKNITIPNSVTNIGTEAFESCLNINVADNNLYFSDIDGVLFNKDGTTLIQYPNGRIAKKYMIPNGVKTINNYAFGGGYLNDVYIPVSVTDIGNDWAEYNYLLSSAFTIKFAGNDDDWENINKVGFFDSYEDAAEVITNCSFYSSTTYNSDDLAHYFQINLTDIIDGMRIYIGAYDELDSLINMKSIKTDSLKVSFDKAQNISYFKVFVWTTELSPLSNVEKFAFN